MRSIVEVGASVPAFLGKLWKLVNDSETDHLISWSPGGKTFIIKNQAEFARVLLPQYYKHNNMASFIRQLNMYGFHKITSVENGGLRYEKDEIEFSHPCFLKGHAYLLEHIKRKIANPKGIIMSEGGDKLLVKPELMSKVLADVKQMKGKQESMDAKFSVMKQENEALWREVAMLRQKHIKQQQIVNNLIQFLMSLVQPSRSNNMNSHGVKRRYQLMINDAAHNSRADQPGAKNPKLEQELFDDLNEETICEGPTIHELVHDDMVPCEDTPSPVDPSNYVTIEIPQVSPASGPGSSHTPTQYHVTMEDGDDTDNVEPLLMTYSSAGRSRMATSPQVTSPPAPVSPLNSAFTITPDMRLPADIFASDDSAQDSQRDSSLVSKDVLLPSENLPNYTGMYVQPQSVNIKQEMNTDSCRWKKPTSNEETRINLADIKTELQDADFNSMSLATVNNGNINRGQTMNIRDIINNNEDRTSKYGSSKNKAELDDHLDTMQNDLDSLRELLRSDSYSFDANTLLGLFGNEDPLFGLNFNTLDEKTKANNNARVSKLNFGDDEEFALQPDDSSDANQLMSYTGTIPDFGDFSLPDDETSQEAILDALDESSTLNTPQVPVQSPYCSSADKI